MNETCISIITRGDETGKAPKIVIVISSDNNTRDKSAVENIRVRKREGVMCGCHKPN